MAFDLVARLKLQGPVDIDQTVRRIQSKLQSVSVNVALNVPSGTDTALKNFNTSLSATNKELRAIAASGGAAAKALAAVKSSVSGAQNSMKKVASSTKGVSHSLHDTAKNAEMAATEIGEFGRISALALRRFAGFSLTAGLMIGLVVQIRRGISAAIDFEREIVRVQQVTGKTVSGLRGLTDAIGAMSTAYGVSSGELAEVTRVLSQAGLTAKQTQVAMEAIAKSDLSPTFDNMKQTTEGVIAAMRQFQIQGKEVEAALGSINAVASSFAVESSDIISAIRRTGGAFKAAGGDLNELIALFTSVRATTRESADSIATGFRTIFTRMQRPRTIQFLKEFGIELQNMEGHFIGPYKAVQKLHMALKDLDPRDIRFSRIIEELGGFRQVSKAIPLIQQFTTAQQAMVASLAGSESVTEDAEIAQRSLSVQIGKVAEEYNKLFREIGESKLFKQLAEWALLFAKNLTDVIRQVRPLIPLLGAIGAIQGMRMASQFGRGFSQGLFPVARKESEAIAQQQVAAQSQNTQAVEKNTVAQQSEATTAKIYTDALGLNTAALSKLTTGIMALSKVIPMMPGAKGRGMALGGSVPGAGNRDTVPAMLTPGEFVVNKHAARQFGYGNLREINQMSGGGRVMGSSLAKRGGSSVLGRTLLSGQQRSPSRTSISPTNVARSALGVWNQDQGEFWRRMTEIHGFDKIRLKKDKIQMMFDDMRRYPHQAIKPEVYGVQSIFGHQSIGPRDIRPSDYDAFRDSANVMYDPRLEHVLGYARGGVVPGGPGRFGMPPHITYAYKKLIQFRRQYGLKKLMPNLPKIMDSSLYSGGAYDEDEFFGLFIPANPYKLADPSRMDQISDFYSRYHSQQRLDPNDTRFRRFNKSRVFINRRNIAENAMGFYSKLGATARHEAAGHTLDNLRLNISDPVRYFSKIKDSPLNDFLLKHKDTVAQELEAKRARRIFGPLKPVSDKPRTKRPTSYDNYLKDPTEVFAFIMSGDTLGLRRIRRQMMLEGHLGQQPYEIAKQQQARIDKIMAGRSKAQGYARGGMVQGYAPGGVVKDPRIRLAYQYAKQYKKKFGLGQELDRLPHIREFDKDDYMDEASAYGYFRNTNVHDMRRLMTSRRGFNEPRGEIALNLQLIKNNAKLKDTIFHELSHRVDAQAGGGRGYASDRSGSMWHLWITKNKQRLFDDLQDHLARRMMLPYIQGKSDNDLIRKFASNPDELIAGVGKRSAYDALPTKAKKVAFIKDSLYRNMGMQAGRFLSDQPDSEYFARMMAGSSPSLRRLRREFLSQDIFGGEHLASQAQAEQARIAKIMEGRGKIQGYARGGVVPGVGSGDTVPALLEPGEFVVRKSAVEAMGTDALHNINRYADGGVVRKYARGTSGRGVSGMSLEEQRALQDYVATIGGVPKAVGMPQLPTSIGAWPKKKRRSYRLPKPQLGPGYHAPPPPPPPQMYSHKPVSSGDAAVAPSGAHAGQAGMQAIFTTMMLGNFASTLVDADSAAQSWIQGATNMVVTFNAMRIAMGAVQGLAGNLEKFVGVMKTGIGGSPTMTNVSGMLMGAQQQKFRLAPQSFPSPFSFTPTGPIKMTRYGHADALSKQLTGLGVAAAVTATLIAGLSAALIYFGEQARKESHEMAKDARTGPEMQAAIDKRKWGRSLSQAGWGTAIGGGIGFLAGSIAGPLGMAIGTKAGMAIGAAVGGGGGFAHGWFGNMEAEIKELRKINRDSRVQEASDSTRHALDRLTSGNIEMIGSNELRELGTGLETLRTSQFQAEMAGDKDAALSYSRELRGMAAQVQNVRDHLVSGASTLDEFESRTSAGAQIIQYMAAMQRTSTYAIREQIKEEIAERNKAKEALEKETHARERAVSLISTLNQFNAAMVETVQRLERAGDTLEGIAGLARGDVVMPEFRGKPGFGEFSRITQGGVFDIKQFEDAIRQVGGGLGSQADNYMLNNTIEIAQTIDKLPQVIRNVVAAGASALDSEQLSGKFRDEFKALLGVKDDEGNSQITRAQEMVMNTIGSGIDRMIGAQGEDKGVGHIINRMRTDEAGVLRELGLQDFEPIFKEWDEIAQGQLQAMQALDKAIGTRIQLETDMARKRIDLARQELSNRQEIFELTKAWPTDEFGADRVRESRGAQIAGVLQGTRAQGADPFDVERIGGALSRVNSEIERLGKERQEMKVIDDTNREAAMEMAVEFGSLNTEAQKLRMALGVLADTTDEAAQIRQTLNRLEEEKKGQFGLLERYMFAGREEQQKILTSIHDVMAVRYGGVDIRRLPDDRRQAVGALAHGEFRNIRAMAFGIDDEGQGLTGGHFSRDVVMGGTAGMKVPPQWQWLFGADLSGPAGRVAPGAITDEQAPLIDKMKQLHEEKHKAELVALQLTQDAHTKFIGTMGEEFKKFTTTLIDSLRQAERATMEREKSVLQARIGDIEIQQGALTQIKEMASASGIKGLTDQGALKLAQVIAERKEGISRIEDRYGRAATLDRGGIQYGKLGITPDIEALGVDPKRFMAIANSAWKRALELPTEDFGTVFQKQLGAADQDFVTRLDTEGLLDSETVKDLHKAIAQRLEEYNKVFTGFETELTTLTKAGIPTPKRIREGMISAPQEAFQDITTLVSNALREASAADVQSIQADTIGADPKTLSEFSEFLSKSHKPILDLSKSLGELGKVNVESINTNLANFTKQLEQLQIRLDSLGEGGGGGEVADAHAAGGPIFRSRGTDTVPAMLTPGEFVVKRSAAQKNMELLKAINSGESPMYASRGGAVSPWGPLDNETLTGVAGMVHRVIANIMQHVTRGAGVLSDAVSRPQTPITDEQWWSHIEDAFPKETVEAPQPSVVTAPTQTLSPSQQRAAQRAAARRGRLGKGARDFAVHPQRQREMDQRERVRARLRGEDVAHMPRRHQEDIDARVRARSDALRAKKQANLNDIEDKLSRVRQGSRTERMYLQQKENLEKALKIDDYKEFLNYRSEGSQPKDPEGNILPPGIYRGGVRQKSTKELIQARAERDAEIRQRSQNISAEMQARRDAIRAQNQQRTEARIKRENEQQPGIYADGQLVDRGEVRRRLNQRPTTGMWYDEPEVQRERPRLWYNEPAVERPQIKFRHDEPVVERPQSTFWYGDGPSPTTPKRPWETDEPRKTKIRPWDTNTAGRPVGPAPQPVTTSRVTTPEPLRTVDADDFFGRTGSPGVETDAAVYQRLAGPMAPTQPAFTPRHPPGTDPRFRTRGHTPQKPLHQLRAESQGRMGQIQARRAEMEREFEGLPAESLEHRRRLNQKMLLAENQDTLMRIVGGDSVEGARARLEAMRGRVQAYDQLMTPEVPDAKTQRAMLDAESELNLRRPVRGTGAYAPDAVAPQRTRRPLGFDRPPVETPIVTFESMQALSEEHGRRRDIRQEEYEAGRAADKQQRRTYDARTRELERLDILSREGVVGRDATPEEADRAFEQLRLDAQTVRPSLRPRDMQRRMQRSGLEAERGRYDALAADAQTQGALNRRTLELSAKDIHQLHPTDTLEPAPGFRQPSLPARVQDFSAQPKLMSNVQPHALARRTTIGQPALSIDRYDISRRGIAPPSLDMSVSKPQDLTDEEYAFFAEEMERISAQNIPKNEQDGRAILGQPKIYPQEALEAAAKHRAILQDTFERAKQLAFRSSREGYAKNAHKYTSSVEDPSVLPTYAEAYETSGASSLQQEIADLDDWVRSQHLLREERRVREAYKPNARFTSPPNPMTPLKDIKPLPKSKDVAPSLDMSRTARLEQGYFGLLDELGIGANRLYTPDFKEQAQDRTGQYFVDDNVIGINKRNEDFWSKRESRRPFDGTARHEAAHVIDYQLGRKEDIDPADPFNVGRQRLVPLSEVKDGPYTDWLTKNREWIIRLLQNEFPAIKEEGIQSNRELFAEIIAGNSQRIKELRAQMFEQTQPLSLIGSLDEQGGNYRATVTPKGSYQIYDSLGQLWGAVHGIDDAAERGFKPHVFHSGGLVPGSGNQSAILQGGEFVLPRPVVQALAKGGVVQGYQDGGTTQTPAPATGGGTGFQLVLADDAKSAMQGFAKTVQDFAGVVQGMEGFPANLDGIVARWESSISAIPTEIKLDADLSTLISSLEGVASRWESSVGDMPTEFSLDASDVGGMLSRFTSDFTTNVGALQQTMSEFATNVQTLPESIGSAFGVANTGMIESANALSNAMGEFNSGAALLGQSAAQLASTVAEFAAAADGMRGAAIEIRNALAQEVKISVTHTHQPLTVVVEGGETLTQDGDAFGEMVMRVVGPEIDRLRDRIRDTGFGIA